ERRQVVGAEPDRAIHDVAANREEAEHGEPDRRLPATRLADEADGLPARDRERDVVDGVHRRVAKLDVDLQPVDGEHRGGGRAHLRLSRTSNASRSASPMKLKQTTVSTIAMPGG